MACDIYVSSLEPNKEPMEWKRFIISSPTFRFSKGRMMEKRMLLPFGPGPGPVFESLREKSLTTMSTIREMFYTYSDARQTNEKSESDLGHLIFFNPQDIVPIRFKLVEKFKSGCLSDTEADDPHSYPTDIFFEDIGSIVAREEVSIDYLSSLKQKSERNLHKEHFGSILSKSLGVPEDLHPPIIEKLFEVVDDEDSVPLLPIEVVITNVTLSLTSRWLESLAQK